MDALRYPIGDFVPVAILDPAARGRLIGEVPMLAASLRILVGGLAGEQLDVPYRPGGWTIRQIVHHLADNDMNAYLRFKRALTEDEPLGSSYREDLWAELRDYRELPPAHSIGLMAALHDRFALLLAGLPSEAFGRRLRTQALGSITLDTALQRFVWHHRHHRAHIEGLMARKGWR